MLPELVSCTTQWWKNKNPHNFLQQSIQSWLICVLTSTWTDTASHSLTQLSYEVKQHKASGQEVATAPGSLDVVSLLIPLKPHADAVFQEGADETQSRQVGQVLFGYPQELVNRVEEEDKWLTRERKCKEKQSRDVVFLTRYSTSLKQQNCYWVSEL